MGNPPENILYEVEGHLALITLNRPDAHNAYSADMVGALVSALHRADDDKNVRCILITGAGRSFSAGGDLKLMRDRAGMFEGDPLHLRERYRRGIQTIPRAFESIRTPVIAAVNGAAIGAGLDLACMCDIRVASSRAKFGQTFVKLGLVPGDGGAYFLQRVVGFPRALELALTGKIINATRALEIDLVHYVVEPEALITEAKKIAESICANAPQAVQLTRRACYQAQHQSVNQALETAATYQGIAQNTRDHKEGVDAILAKRQPQFTGE